MNSSTSTFSHGSKATIEVVILREGLFLLICKEPNLTRYESEEGHKRQVQSKGKLDFQCFITYYIEPVLSPGNQKQADVHLEVSLVLEQGVAVPKIDATMDGVRQTMLRSTSTTRGENSWNIAWKNHLTNCCNGQFPSCRYCGSRFNSVNVFEIMIDFGQTDGAIIMKPGQRAVLQNMGQLLADRTLADVTFEFPGI